MSTVLPAKQADDDALLWPFKADSLNTEAVVTGRGKKSARIDTMGDFYVWLFDDVILQKQATDALRRPLQIRTGSCMANQVKS